ncbi:MAG: sigma E positive regulator RseC/MucC [Alteromonadaceae bacterium]|nr:sigma E positive regulator RseC/MucC [Alteromonadaceae bacterium]
MVLAHRVRGQGPKVIEQSGLVVAVEGLQAWVRVEREGSCQRCSARNGCGQRLMAELSGPAKAQQVRVDNELRARVGDKVLLGLGEQTLLWASLKLYFLPLLGLILGAAAGTWLFGNTEPAVVLVATGAMMLVFFLTRLWSNEGEVRPQMLEVLQPRDADQPVALTLQARA